MDANQSVESKIQTYSKTGFFPTVLFWLSPNFFAQPDQSKKERPRRKRGFSLYESYRAADIAGKGCTKEDEEDVHRIAEEKQKAGNEKAEVARIANEEQKEAEAEAEAARIAEEQKEAECFKYTHAPIAASVCADGVATVTLHPM